MFLISLNYTSFRMTALLVPIVLCVMTQVYITLAHDTLLDELVVGGISDQGKSDFTKTISIDNLAMVVMALGHHYLVQRDLILTVINS
jgi:hypothetical protein